MVVLCGISAEFSLTILELIPPTLSAKDASRLAHWKCHVLVRLAYRIEQNMARIRLERKIKRKLCPDDITNPRNL